MSKRRVPLLQARIKLASAVKAASTVGSRPVSAAVDLPAERMECVELAPAFGSPCAYDSGSKLHALHTLRGPSEAANSSVQYSTASPTLCL